MKTEIAYQLETAAQRFRQKLEALDVNTLSVEGYPKSYFLYLLVHRKHYIELYVQVLQKLLFASKKLPEDLILIDYGCGNGFLSFLGAFAGFSKIVSIDTDVEFLKSAQVTASVLGLKEIEFIHANEETFDGLISIKQPAVLAATDVIEHIYNLDLFFLKLKKIEKIRSILFTTASNPKNPFIVKRYHHLHLKEELQGGNANDRNLFGDAHASFLELRQKIIIEHFPFFVPERFTSLAKATRGLRRDDIIKHTQKFLQTGVLTNAITHPTNTCHPETGSWAERLMEIDELKILFQKNEFELKISNGFYDSNKGSIVRRCCISVLNAIIRNTTDLGIRLAPFIFLEGNRK